MRDEGTSFHYAPPSRQIHADPATVAIAIQVLDERVVPFTAGTTWTTDAPYPETTARIRRRRDEGCLTVEMEAAAQVDDAVKRAPTAEISHLKRIR